jgi:8-oxo-dGTP pyrophosphatase MutT (NUDIX family)
MPAVVNTITKRHQGRVVKLFTENVTLENGVTIDVDLIRHPGAAAIVPLTQTGQVILVWQYRHAVGGYLWEIPAGTLDPGETCEACAKRELVEETGYRADTWQRLGEIVPVPGYADERIHLFLATDLTRARQHLEADEILHVHPVALTDALSMIAGGQIIDSKTINGLFLAHHWLSRATVSPEAAS